MLLPDFGEEGQRRLSASHALLVGCGALGCAIADHVVRAGVGTLTIVDRDVVELTNLQRQVLFDERDAAEGVPKAEAARRRLAAINSAVEVGAIVADFSPANAERIVSDVSAPVSVLLDGTDNFETRYLINDLAVKRGLPYVYGGAVGTHGMQMTVIPGRTACLRCVFEEMPPPGTAATCDTVGVLGPAVAIVAACQAADAIKLMLGRPDLVAPTLLEFDLWRNERRRLDLSSIGPRAECPCCGQTGGGRFEFLEGRHTGLVVSLCGQGAVQVSPPATARVDLEALAARLRPHGAFTANRFLLRGTLDRERSGAGGSITLTVFPDGRAIVKGTETPEAARSIYAKYVGV